MIFGKFGTAPNDEGGFSYDNHKNPLLIQGVKGFNYSMYRPTDMNPAAFATFQAASAIAQILGGEVVPDPFSSHWNLSIPVSAVHAIKLSDGSTINAGYICDVMGNDIAYSSAAAKSYAICMDNALPLDLHLADKLFNILEGVAG